MDANSLDYRALAAGILRDSPGVRTAVTGATLHFDANRAGAYGEIDSDAWRRWAGAVKSNALTHLDRYLEQAATNLAANGCTVHWATTAADACDTLVRIATEAGVRRVVKGKSMLSEEVGVNERLESGGIEVFETDLGEYILQLLGEKPSHILGPAIHRSLDDIRALFHERLGTATDAAPEVLAARARDRLREAFLTADMGITGGNFVAADTGTIALIENEGNIRLSTSVPRVHVALVGIEKIVPRFADLAHLLQLTARAATGQPIGTFVSLVQGPRTGPPGDAPAARQFAGAESDGPDQVHVIFIDNGRSRVLADPVMWEALRCVRCGACLNICPVYRQTGGHAYGWVYSGPIGAVLAPGLLGLEKASALPYASSLCGACADACPVRIDLPAMLLEWRARAVRAGLVPESESRQMAWFASLATHPRAFHVAGAAFRAAPARIRRSLPLLSDWTRTHAALEPEGRGFLSAWKRDRKRPAGPPIPGGERELGGDTAIGGDVGMGGDAGVGGERRIEGGGTTAGADSETSAPGRAGAVADGAAAAGSDSETSAPGRAGMVADSAAAGDVKRQSGGGVRRAFASGSLGRSSRDAAGSAGTDNPVLRAVREALDGRTRLSHPGSLETDGSSTDGRAIPGPAAQASGSAESGTGPTENRGMPGPEARGAERPGGPDSGAVHRFIERFQRNGGEAIRFHSAADASAWLSDLIEGFETCDVGLLVAEHLSPSTAGLAAAPAERAELGVSMAAAAAADTGTLLLDSRDGRATQLLPPTHLVWVRGSTVAESLVEALAGFRERLPAAIGLHSGPSRSADIGRILVTGVHGPGRVIAAIVP